MQDSLQRIPECCPILAVQSQCTELEEAHTINEGNSDGDSRSHLNAMRPSVPYPLKPGFSDTVYDKGGGGLPPSLQLSVQRSTASSPVIESAGR